MMCACPPTFRERRGRRGAYDPRRGAVPDDPRQLCDERLDRDGRRGCGTTVTGVQEAITFYTLVMATLMITGGKIGGMFGRKRAFSIGCIIYGSGSLVTSLAPNLTVLILGWSVLEGVGAALIMPAIVALVAATSPPTSGPVPTASSPPPARSRSRSGR